MVYLFYSLLTKEVVIVVVFFQHLTKFLNITHRTSATMASRSNGLAENLVQRVAQIIKYYLIVTAILMMLCQ